MPREGPQRFGDRPLDVARQDQHAHQVDIGAACDADWQLLRGKAVKKRNRHAGSVMGAVCFVAHPAAATVTNSQIAHLRPRQWWPRQGGGLRPPSHCQATAKLSSLASFLSASCHGVGMAAMVETFCLRD